MEKTKNIYISEELHALLKATESAKTMQEKAEKSIRCAMCDTVCNSRVGFAPCPRVKG